jgi:hypothetical protein
LSLSNFSVYDAQIDLSALTKNSKNDSKIVGISLFHAALVDAVDSNQPKLDICASRVAPLPKKRVDFIVCELFAPQPAVPAGSHRPLAIVAAAQKGVS